jgi:hypothetical protein
MADLLQSAGTPDFIPATPPTASTTQSSTADPDFVPASPSASASPTPSQQDPDFIPAGKPEQEGGWFNTIFTGVKNTAWNSLARPGMTALQLGSAIYNKDLDEARHVVRNNIVTGLLPFLSDNQVDENVETTPDQGIVSGKGAWAKTKSVANLPLGGTFHRKGAGAIEGETEDWLTSQLNPLNIGLAVASMGSSVVEGGLVKAGISATRAAGLVRYSKLAVDLGFLSKFGYPTFTEAIPKFEQDWADYNNETDPSKKAQLLDKLEREGTDTVLGSLAAGLATRGIESDIHEISTQPPKGKALANTDYNNAIHEYQMENQLGSAQGHQTYREGMAAVPDQVRQEAMSANVEAAGNPNVLQQWADAASEDSKKGFEAAKNLTDKEKSVMAMLKSKLDALKMNLRQLNLLAPDGGRDNYVPHRPVFEDEDPVTGEPISRTAADGERDFLKKRIYDSHAAGEAAGIKYKTKSFIKLVSDYIERANNLIARNNLGESLAKATMNEGSPMAVSGGYLGVPRDIELTPTEVQLLKQQGKFDALLAKGRIYEVKPGDTGRFSVPQEQGTAPNGNAPAPEGAIVKADPDFIPATESTTDRMVNHGLLPRGEFPEGYHDAQDSTTGGSVNVKKGAGDTTIARKVEAHRAAIGDISQLSDVAQGKASDAQARYQELIKQRNEGNGSGVAPPKPPIEPPLVGGTRPTQPVYKWKFSDYRDSGLRVNRPTANVDHPSNAIVAHPDQNAFPGEAILRQGEGGGIPTDPRTGQPMARVPVYVHPEITPHLNPVLDSTAPKSALVRGALKMSGAAKSVLLSLSPFHWFTVATRALEANPGGGLGSIAHNAANVVKMPNPVDYFNLKPEQMQAIKDGLVVANTRPGFSGYTEEGNVAGSESFASKIPYVGKLNHAIEARLFGPQGFITGLKFDLYDKLKGEYVGKGMAPEQAGRVAASQVNNKFGGLNYTLLGRSANTQAAMRAALLAPDFLESTGRSVMDVAGKYGQGLVKSLVAFNLLHYAAARAINYVVNGQFHPESGFKVLSPDGKKEYGIRTTLGDFLHFAEHPRDFMMNRVNPLLVRTPMELIQGVDQQGNKVSDDQRMWDTIRQVTPIPLQSLTPKQQITQPSRVDELLKSIGVQSSKKFTPAETLAYQRSTSRNQRTPLEGDDLEDAQKKFKLADELRSAIQAKDAQGIAKATQNIVSNVKGDNPLLDAKQAQDMINDAHTYKTRLESTIHHLPLEDALDVWDAASTSERKSIRTAINKKIADFYSQASAGKKPAGQLRALQPRIKSYLAEKP